jgi:DNA-binding ferritin-like protein (Dps family)
MFGIEIALAQMLIAQHEREHFQKRLMELPEDQRPAYEKAYRELKERQYKEATVERRHQELCQAIRDSRPRSIGLFL